MEKPGPTRCERLKILSYPEGMYAVTTHEASPPCRYTVRWCPKIGHVVTLVTQARAQEVFRVVREHRVLGDTIDHLMELSLD